MARKASRVSLRKRVSKALITRRRDDGGVISGKKKATTSSKKRKNATAVVGLNKSTKKKARKKMKRRRNDGSTRKSGSDAVTNNGGGGGGGGDDSSVCRDAAVLKIAWKKSRAGKGVVVGKKKTAADSRDSDSGVGGAAETTATGEIVSVGEAAQSAMPVSAAVVREEQHADEEGVPGDSTSATNDFPKAWTEEMIRYYFEPNEKRKSFDYVKIMENIEYKASDWLISEADRTGNRGRGDYFIRCAKCNRKGHTKKECKKNAVCYVCGEFNHDYSQCPNAVCLTCGRATKKYSNSCRQCRKILNGRKTCTLCGQLWHEETLCPSRWRQYSLVAQSDRDSAIRLNSRKYCYNCAQRGHFGFECPLGSQSDFPPENPLKTAFPFQQRRFVSGADGQVDAAQVNEARHIDNADADQPRVHVIFLAKQTSDILCSEIGNRFLTNLSRNANIRIELFRGKRSYIKLFGDLKIVEYCKCQLLEWQT